MERMLTHHFLGDALLVHDVPAFLTTEKLGGKQKVPCRLCNETIELSHMRNHVGHHILYSMRDVPDDVELNRGVSNIPGVSVQVLNQL